MNRQEAYDQIKNEKARKACQTCSSGPIINVKSSFWPSYLHISDSEHVCLFIIHYENIY